MTIDHLQTLVIVLGALNVALLVAGFALMLAFVRRALR